MDAVILNRGLALATLTVSRQLARSLDAALHAKWEDFLCFFTHEDRWIHDAVLQRLKEVGGGAPTSGQVDSDSLRALRWYSSWISRVIFMMKGEARFPRAEIFFITTALEAGTQSMKLTQRPSNDEIAELRMNLSVCEVLIERRVPADVSRASRAVSHFNASAYQNFNSISEILGADVETIQIAEHQALGAED